MEDMIKRIIDMDRKAQEITEAARREKLESEKELVKRAEALKEEYLDRARRRIQINAETEQTLLEQKWRKREEYYAEQTARLERLYAQKHTQWVADIVKKVKES